MSTKGSGLTKYRMDELDKKVNDLNEKMDKLMSNHLPHINEDIIGLKTRVNLMTAINLGGIILGLIVAKFIK